MFMEWDWKEFAWDPSGLEFDNIGFESGGGGKKKKKKNEEAASVDLRLGETSDLMGKTAADDTTPKELKDSKTLSSPSGSSKRSRLHNGKQVSSCVVDGCNSDLSDCREYHRRHRVCEKHSKTPVVLVAGKQQRFCQQCSRFHSLGEFDDIKRSCRKRLDGHNRRRRKPQPPSLFMAAEKFLYNCKGPRILQFGSPQTYVNPIMRNMWPASVKTGAESDYDHRQILYRIDKHKQEKELLLWQENGPKASNSNAARLGTTNCQPTCGSITPPESGKGSRKLSSESKAGSFDSSCALYLLSTVQSQSSEMSLVKSSITCPIQSPSGSVHLDEYSCSERPIDKPAGPVLVLDANTSNLHCNGMMHMGPEGLVKNGDSLNLPFFWE